MTPTEYKALRRKLSLTQTGLAARLGVSRATIAAREAGKAQITPEAEHAIARLAGLPLPPLQPGDAGPAVDG